MAQKTPEQKKPEQRSAAHQVRVLAVNLLVAAGSIGLLLGIVELTLRLTGFSYALQPEDIEFGKPDPQLMRIGFLQDEDLFWVTKNYGEKLERLRREQPPLVFMGDSCTHLGHYDEHFARLVEERFGHTMAYGNMGVAGWSTHQGLRQLQRDVLPSMPEVVTFYYGWNDHWIGFGVKDAQVEKVRRVFSSRVSHLRLVQLVSKATLALAARRQPWPNRVPLEDFIGNLRTMVREALKAGTRPVLITAASSHRQGQEPEHLGDRWLHHLADLVPLHQSYVAAVRRVAVEESVLLCDPAAVFGALPQVAMESLFMADGIHLTDAGDQRLAAVLFECFEAAGLFESTLHAARAPRSGPGAG
jgi:lysophospholipase L1-like esterase